MESPGKAGDGALTPGDQWGQCKHHLRMRWKMQKQEKPTKENTAPSRQPLLATLSQGKAGSGRVPQPYTPRQETGGLSTTKANKQKSNSPSFTYPRCPQIVKPQGDHGDRRASPTKRQGVDAAVSLRTTYAPRTPGAAGLPPRVNLPTTLGEPLFPVYRWGN